MAELPHIKIKRQEKCARIVTCELTEIKKYAILYSVLILNLFKSEERTGQKMDKIFWKSEKRKISELIPAKYNPRKWPEKSKASLSESLDKFSLSEPILINANNTVIGGHFRLHILKTKFGKDYEVDVRTPNRVLNESEEKELNLRMNKNGGEWDLDLLSSFEDGLLENVGFDLNFIKKNKKISMDEIGFRDESTEKSSIRIVFNKRQKEDFKKELNPLLIKFDAEIYE